jgi:hypothetical protein
MSEFFNLPILESFSAQEFNKTKPFPNHLFKKILLPEAFNELYNHFPCLDLFEKHVNKPRGKSGQRPHNRYYLAFEKSIYHKNDQSGSGVAKIEQLPKVWQDFVREVQTFEPYQEFLRRSLNLDEYVIRYAWHVGETGSEVSPHCDSFDKIGTHIFYFNTSADWEVEWGGSILALGGKRTAKTNPDISDFETVESFDIRDNSSFLFKNTADGWHATEVLTCPPNHYRRLFNVIVQKRKTEKTLKKLWHYLSGKN